MQGSVLLLHLHFQSNLEMAFYCLSPRLFVALVVGFLFVLHSGFFVSFCWTGSWWSSVEDFPVGADSQHMLKSGWTSRVRVRGMSK